MNTIRQAVWDDWNKGLKACLESFGPIEGPDWHYRNAFFNRAKHDVRTLVLVKDELVIGTASFFIEDKLIHDGWPAAHVEDVATHPDHRGKGVASILIDRIIRHCHEIPCYKILLDCTPELEPFYARFGFVSGRSGMRLSIEGSSEFSTVAQRRQAGRVVSATAP